MKKYDLIIECMREDFVGEITEMFSKGHHEETAFKAICKEVYSEECRENDEDEPNEYSFIDDAKIYHKWGKIVGCFEDGQRVGWTLSESKEHKRGYFPMTKIDI
ncbi:MAG: hypothetical protein K0S61_673 [Anaerocolumna sp.]|jgi:hypothetical protein|nr:hypothetical protein [Anaerocolumna sp.]